MLCIIKFGGLRANTSHLSLFYCAAQAGLGLLTLLAQPPTNWNLRQTLLCLACHPSLREHTSACAFYALCRDSTSRPQLTMTQRQRDQLSCHLTVLLLAKTKGEKLHHEPRLLNRAAEHQAESSEDYIFTRCTPR